MKNGNLIESAWVIKDKLPPACQPVIVVGERYRCLGYADAGGVWRGWFGQGALEKVVGWMAEAAPPVPLFRRFQV